MIRARRQQHRIIILVLAVLVPIIFVAGLLARNPVRVNHELPHITQGVPR